MESLPGTLRELVDELRLLRSDVRTDSRQRRRESFITLGIAATLLVFLGVIFTVAWQNQQLSNQIRDCTTAGGKCYEEGRKRTGSAVQDIVKANVYVHECDKVTTTDADLEKCVARKLSQD